METPSDTVNQMQTTSNELIALYASTSGNTEIVVETVVEKWRGAQIELQTFRVENADQSLLSSHSLFLFASSTWEHGAINPFFKTTLEQMKTMKCNEKYACFIGLGDTRYEPVLFCGGLQKIREIWKNQGGVELSPVLLINGDPYQQLNNRVTEWADKLIEPIKNLQSIRT